jgi:hypothetical protein
MIALRVQDPAARHEEAIGLPSHPDSLFLAIMRFLRLSGI